MTDAVTPAPSSAGLWEDFIDILYQPSAVFERRREGAFGLALLILAMLIGILTIALHNGLAPIMDAEFSKQAASMAAKNPNMTAEQIASAQSMMEKTGMFVPAFFVPIGALFSATLLWIVGRFVDAKVAFKGAMMIATYSLVPTVISMIVSAVQGLFLAPESITSHYSVSLGLARFLDATTANPILLTLLGGIDVFTIWTTVLLAIGLSVVARVPIKRAAVAAVIVWLVGLLPALYGAVSQAT